jgi:hypothetical protein
VLVRVATWLKEHLSLPVQWRFPEQASMTTLHSVAKSARLQWLTPVIPATQEAEMRRIMVGSQPRKIVAKLNPKKYSTQKRAGRVAQVIEDLPSKCEALSSNPTTRGGKKKQKNLQSLPCLSPTFLWEPVCSPLSSG